MADFLLAVRHWASVARRRIIERNARRGKRLWPVWLVVPLALILAISSTLNLQAYLGQRIDLVGERPEALDLTKIALSVMAGLGAVLAGVYAYRKQRTLEEASTRAEIDAFVARYSSAAELLGSEKPAVRVAGAYAMAALADDWPSRRQQCVDVLCAYLRMGNLDMEEGEVTVRFAVLRLICGHLLSPRHPHNWCGMELNFAGAELQDADFDRCAFLNVVSFAGVTFRGETSFRRTTFDGIASFDNSKFVGPTSFAGVRARGMAVTFRGAVLKGDVSFERADFTAVHASFEKSQFCGIASFRGAVFQGESLLFEGSVFHGLTSFVGAHFRCTETSFSDASLEGDTTSFARARFDTRRTVAASRFLPRLYSSKVVVRDLQRIPGQPNRPLRSRLPNSANLVLWDGATFSGGALDFRDSYVGNNVQVYSQIQVVMHNDQRIDCQGSTFLGGWDEKLPPGFTFDTRSLGQRLW